MNPISRCMLLISLLVMTSGLAVALPVHAAENAPSAWNPLGRLFTTPHNREILNKLRLGENVPDPEKEKKAAEKAVSEQKNPEKPEKPPIQGPRYITINGMLRKHDGQQVVWLNGKSIDPLTGSKGEGYSIPAVPAAELANGLPILLEDHASPFRLKPGQTLDAEKKAIRDSYQIPETERRSARRGPLPSAPLDKTVSSANEPAPDTNPNPALPPERKAALPTNTSSPKTAAADTDLPSPDKIFDMANKVRQAGQSGDLMGLLKTVKEVTHALGQ
ncbi:MAG: hypothetical protein HQL66_15630 [Magnetococcales bacterium]|nr:hypothetical protein [Magnetococcales bacterium]